MRAQHHRGPGRDRTFVNLRLRAVDHPLENRLQADAVHPVSFFGAANGEVTLIANGEEKGDGSLFLFLLCRQSDDMPFICRILQRLDHSPAACHPKVFQYTGTLVLVLAE